MNIRIDRIALLMTLCTAAAVAQGMNCDLTGYHAQDGLKARSAIGALEIAWDGERHEQLRARFAIHSGQPLIEELAARKAGGNWIVLGQNLTPEFEITRASGAFRSNRSNPSTN